MTDIPLPPHISGERPADLPPSQQITLIGANGSGKSKFMAEMMSLVTDRAYCLSALSSSFPERRPSKRRGSIDALYEEAANRNSYIRPEAVSELDKLCYLLFIEEFEYLLKLKADYREFNDQRQQQPHGDEKHNAGRGRSKKEFIEIRPTKLDRLIRMWEEIFPGNKILRGAGQWLFHTDAGDDTIAAERLSAGERTVLYYIGATMYAPKNGVIFITAPELFLHPAILNTVWNKIESLRPDCTFIYDTSDADFVSSRTENACIWVRSFDAEQYAWDYQVLASGQMNEDLFVDLVGARRPVLFIEGDAEHSIDAKLYTLVFSDYAVRPLGSCNKVIESTRTFNDLKPMHHLNSRGIVDRDRRTAQEVEYLRKKNILVPEVAEVENIFLTEEVVKIMANRRGRMPEQLFAKVKKSVMKAFASMADQQALQHVRHKVKRDVECKIDAKFTCITALETHVKGLVYKLRPREYYQELCREFHDYVKEDNYEGVLRVFNYKPMLAESRVGELLGYPNRDAYVKGVLSALKSGDKDSKALRAAVKYCFGLRLDDTPIVVDETPEPEPLPEPKKRKKSKSSKQNNETR